MFYKVAVNTSYKLLLNRKQCDISLYKQVIISVTLTLTLRWCQMVFKGFKGQLYQYFLTIVCVSSLLINSREMRKAHLLLVIKGAL